MPEDSRRVRQVPQSALRPLIENESGTKVHMWTFVDLKYKRWGMFPTLAEACAFARTCEDPTDSHWTDGYFIRPCE